MLSIARKLDVRLIAQVGVTFCAKCRLTPSASDRASRPNPRAALPLGHRSTSPKAPASLHREGAFFFPETGVKVRYSVGKVQEGIDI